MEIDMKTICSIIKLLQTTLSAVHAYLNPFKTNHYKLQQNCLSPPGRSIIDGGFPTHQPLQHMQKDLKLSLNMGDTLEQPLPLTASANEVNF